MSSSKVSKTLYKSCNLVYNHIIENTKGEIVNNKRVFIKMLVLGVIFALPYVFSFLWPLSWIALIPFIYFLTEHCVKAKKRKAYLWGFGFGLGYYLVMYHWFINFYPMEFAGVTKPAAALLVVVCWVGLALVQAIEFGFVTLIYRALSPRADKPFLCAGVITAIWVLFEWQQNFFWRGVPWARLSVTQTAVPQILQSASLLGNLFISGMIVFVNAMLFYALKHALTGKAPCGIKSLFATLKNQRTALFSGIAFGIFAVNLVFGCVRYVAFDDTSEKKLKAAVIQGNISSLDKWSGYDSIDTYISLTKECVNETGAQLVVWPETVIPTSINLSSFIMDEFAQTADELDITLLVGSFAVEKNDEGESVKYNAMYLFLPDGTVSDQRYYKQRPVPFGEYNPAAAITEIFPVLKVLESFNDMRLSPGEGSQLLDSEFGKLGSIICFDSIYESISRASVNDGAEIITLSTNDSWFNDSAAVWQHNRHAVLRAIENGRYIVRAASTGVSSFISPTGDVLDTIAPLTEGYEVHEVYMLSGRTVYSYVGNVFVYMCLGFVVGLAAYKISLSIKRKALSKDI